MRFITEYTNRGDVKDPQSLNLYTYCQGNPVVYLDLSGNAPIESRPGRTWYAPNGGIYTLTFNKHAFMSFTYMTKEQTQEEMKKYTKTTKVNDPLIDTIKNTIVSSGIQGMAVLCKVKNPMIGLGSFFTVFSMNLGEALETQTEATSFFEAYNNSNTQKVVKVVFHDEINSMYFTYYIVWDSDYILDPNKLFDNEKYEGKFERNSEY